MASNPWDNDPIVQTNLNAPAETMPWAKDPIVQPAEPAAALDPRIKGIMDQQGSMNPVDMAAMQKSLQAQLASPLSTPAAPAEQIGPVRNALGAAFNSMSEIANPLIRGLGEIGAVDPTTAAQAIHTQLAPEQPGMSADIGHLAGGVGTAVMAGPLAPGVFAAQGAEGAQERTEELQRQGQTVTEGERLTDVGGQAALGAAMGYLFGQNVSGGAAKAVEGQLAKIAPQMVARYGARGAVGALINAGQQAAGNALTQQTIDPSQSIMQGTGTAALLGGGTEMAMGAVHDATQPEPQPAPPEPPVAQELSPAAASAHQAILEQEEKLKSLQDQVGDVKEETPPPLSPEVQKTLAENPPEKPAALSAQDVANKASAIDPDVKEGQEGQQATSDYFKGELDKAHGADAQYELRDIPLNSLKLNEDYQPDKVAEYAQQPAESAPPILAGKDGEVIDGATRARAAMARGETTIKGYAPAEVENGQANQVLPATETTPPQEKTPFQRRTVGSDIQAKAGQWKAAVGSAWKAANRLFGTGLGVGEQEAGVRSRLMASGSQIDTDRATLEQAFKGDRDTMDSWSPEAKKTWIEQIEAGQPSTDPKMQPTADALQAMNKDLRTRAEAVGMDTGRWNPTDDWIGRLAEWPDQGQGNGTSLSGPESFLRKRNLDTFGEFKQAVEDSGGRLKYDNPLDMTLAKLNEVNRSVTAREFLQDEQSRGTVKRFAAGQDIPENWETIDDKLASDKGDEYAVHPKYADQLNDTTIPAAKRVARFQELRDAGELVKLPKRTATTDTYGEGGDLQSKQGKAQLESGTGTPPFPKGHLMIDQLLSQTADKGQLAAPKPIADMLNQFIAPGLPKGSIFDKIAGVTRMTTLANFSLSAFHAATTGASNAYLGVRQALDNVMNGEFSLAAKNLGQAANPISAVRRGAEMREQLAGIQDRPELRPLADAIRQSGTRANMPTILERSSWQKALNAYRTGDQAEAGIRFAQSAAGSLSHAIMGNLVPNAKMAALAMAAETATKRGLEGPELASYMQEASRLTDNVAGQVVRSNQFQHRVVQNMTDLIMTAPKFAEGALRIYGGATVDTLKGLANVMQGKGGRITANQQAVVAHLLVHGLIAGATQAITTAANGNMQLPTSFKDLWYPKTGRQNTDGSDERLSLPDPLGVVPSLLSEGPKKALANRINPVWRAIGDVVTNSDYRNVQVRSGNVAEQALQSVGHLAKAALPWSVQQAAQPANPNQAAPSVAQRVGAFAGVRTAPSAVSRSDAENTLHELSGENTPAAPRSTEDADRSSAIGALAQSLRNKQPDARQRISDALAAGTITPQDRAKITEKAQGQPGLAGDLQRSSLDAKQAIQVWDSATDDEKRSIRGIMLSKIANSQTLQPTERREMRQHVLDDMNEMAGAR